MISSLYLFGAQRKRDRRPPCCAKGPPVGANDCGREGRANAKGADIAVGPRSPDFDRPLLPEGRAGVIWFRRHARPRPRGRLASHFRSPGPGVCTPKGAAFPASAASSTSNRNPKHRRGRVLPDPPSALLQATRHPALHGPHRLHPERRGRCVGYRLRAFLLAFACATAGRGAA